MSNNTPLLYAKGNFTLKAPWSTVSGKNYTCVAIRAFSDIYKAGMDVYKDFYVPYQMTEGVSVNGAPFSFKTEAAKQPNIITLKTDDNEFIYVPDTFILGYPDVSTVPYSHVVAIASLGVLPDDFELSHIQTTIQDIINQSLGITVEVKLARAPSTTNPTITEHLALQANRIAAIRNTNSVREELVQLSGKYSALAEKTIVYENLLIRNNLLGG